MNQTPPRRTTLRAFLRECLCDHDAALAIVKVASQGIGLELILVGLHVDEGLLTIIGVICLALALVLAWIQHDPDAPRTSDRPRRSAPAGEIGRMTDDEFDRLLDEVQSHLPDPRDRARRRHARSPSRGAAGLTRPARRSTPWAWA